MDFKVRHKKESLAALLGTVLGLLLLELCGYKGNYTAKFLAALFITLIMIYRYFSYGDDGYIIQDNKVIIKNCKRTHFKISEIKCISQEWITNLPMQKTDSVEYYIILNKSDRKFKINFDFRNYKGQSLLTVLEHNYGVRVNRVV